MSLKIKNGQTILFIGDSITDCGRLAEFSPLGNGYVKIINDMLIAREPAKKFNIINKGISGDRVTGLQSRWYDHVLRHKPDWLSIEIGINDLHSHLYKYEDPVSSELFAKTYENILELTKNKLPKCNILLIDPFFISTDKNKNSLRNKELNAILDYINSVHKMSKKYKTKLVKTHDMFQKLLKYHDPDTFCSEPVHPNLTGHFAIAEAVYTALSC